MALKKYVTTISVYVIAEDDYSAFKESEKIAEQIKKIDIETDAETNSLFVPVPGQLQLQQIDVRPLKSKYYEEKSKQ